MHASTSLASELFKTKYTKTHAISEFPQMKKFK